MEVARRHNLKLLRMQHREWMLIIMERHLVRLVILAVTVFHETKNFTMGEGGALVFQKNEYQEKS